MFHPLFSFFCGIVSSSACPSPCFVSSGLPNKSFCTASLALSQLLDTTSTLNGHLLGGHDIPSVFALNFSFSLPHVLFLQNPTVFSLVAGCVASERNPCHTARDDAKLKFY